VFSERIAAGKRNIASLGSEGAATEPHSFAVVCCGMLQVMALCKALHDDAIKAHNAAQAGNSSFSTICTLHASMSH
jgi:hypothetical protein